MNAINTINFLDTTFTENLKPEESYSYRNMIDIENITRTWFQLMVNLNESPKIREYFAVEQFIEEENDWLIAPTEYTRHFLTTGIVIYEAVNTSNNEQESIVITKDSDQSTIDRIHFLSQQGDYEVTALFRWAGCGMRIPADTTISLDPNIVWPVLNVDTDIDGEKVSVEIANSSNKIVWKEKKGDAEESGKLMVKDKNFQGQARGDFKVPGTIDLASLRLVLPYTCASFDILTKIHLGDEESELVIFTS